MAEYSLHGRELYELVKDERRACDVFDPSVDDDLPVEKLRKGDTIRYVSDLGADAPSRSFRVTRITPYNRLEAILETERNCISTHGGLLAARLFDRMRIAPDAIRTQYFVTMEHVNGTA